MFSIFPDDFHIGEMETKTPAIKSFFCEMILQHVAMAVHDQETKLNS